MNTKMFLATLEHLHGMLEFIKSYCLGKGFDEGAINKIMLAVEEAVVNIIHHGYKNKLGTIEIVCEEIKPKPGVKIIIKDHGIPFDPMQKGVKIKKSHSNPLQDESIGGYGIFLYVEIMDDVEYHRKEDVNFLCLIKYL